jgi:alkanesulfonate monooxygenase SsuD/methylene tetrahydromethanopterin reductase-like flavin-dependent oxidoreductase (luciferase family)
MPKKTLGLVVDGQDSTAILAGIEKAEESGISAAWLITGGTQPDGLTMLSAAASKTQRIMLGTSITPTFPRHPLTLVQQAQVIAELAPGRFRLGIGTGGQSWIESVYRMEYRAPLKQLREHIRITKELLQTGEVDYEGRYFQAHARIPAPIDLPVMASALGPKAFEMCGAEADGAISWVCPRVYLREVALPAINAGAERAGRQAPPLIAHALVCVHESLPEVADGVREQFAYYIALPPYQRVFTWVGFPESIEGIWSDAMVDAVALHGNESQVAEQIKELFSSGVGEVYVSVVTAGSDRAASRDRTMRFLGREAQELA